MTYTSTKWPHTAAAGEVVLRASVGHDGDEQALQLDEVTLTKRVSDEIREMTGIDAQPLEVRIERFDRSFPQYVVGHLARVASIDQLAGELPGFALAGAAYHGIGIPACIESGQRAASTVVNTLRE